MKSSKRTALWFCAGVLLAFTARAQDDQQIKQGPCRGDVEALCKDVKPGEGRVSKCMKDNEAQVSSGCKQHLAHMRERSAAFAEACKEDAAKFCQDVKPGGMRVANCLKKNEAQLSEGCKAAMQPK